MEFEPTAERAVAAHPRRPPAHLSVSLKHNNTPAVNHPAQSSLTAVDTEATENASPFQPLEKRITEESNNSGGSSGGMNVEKWFDQSNKRPSATGNDMLKDIYDSDEPPYFLQQSSNDTSDSGDQRIHRSKTHSYHPFYKASSANDSSDDFRGVIDDLTIENRRLKERLRKYESPSAAHLNKERLFEIKVHGLSSRKRRELEEILRSFSATIDSSEDLSSPSASNSRQKPNPLPRKVSKNDSVSSTSNSRPTDSAYASMTTSGPSSGATGAESGQSGQSGQMQDAKDEKMQDFLRDIPEGLRVGNSRHMTNTQKKKLVVQRLEQLFTGKTGSMVGENSQTLQQQEVSNSASKLGHTSEDRKRQPEGVREAHIGSYDMELDRQRPELMRNNSHVGSGVRDPLNSSPDSLAGSPSPEQRPTRPLDLDPDRAQVAAENADYIRHLGISAPQLLREESADATADADGWIYLNLLINMAQLHIINVTPDFIRSAVTEFSKKLQISPDLNKLRWRGGTTGTHLSSDSGTSSVHQRSPDNSDISDDAVRKRRKTNGGKFAPVNGFERSSASRSAPGPFHYKPLFRRESSNETSFDDSSSPELLYSQSRLRRAMGLKRDRMCGGSPRDDGPMVFYTGAKFFSDLSGDSGSIAVPAHVSGVDKDGYSVHTRNALGCVPRRMGLRERTPSGSLLPFRPFKDYSKGVDLFETPASRPATPDLLSGDTDFDFTTGMNSEAREASPPLCDLDAQGIGGTYPSDHFVYKVRTQWTKVSNSDKPKISPFSTPANPKKFLHTIPKSSLDIFQDGDSKQHVDRLAERMSLLKAGDPMATMSLPHGLIRTENISEELVHLEPSKLPEPCYFLEGSSTEDDLDSSRSSGILHLRNEVVDMSPNATSDNDVQVSSGGPYENGMDIDDDNSSIDMLAYARQCDPITIAAREEDFDREASDRLVELGSTYSNGSTEYSTSKA
ncbi:frequency clock protein [Rutstroemia sp. NJR-2017a WRK4]|nr:frequency clock protein [Rutstroemia sp. NJR-2017a WRK4]